MQILFGINILTEAMCALSISLFSGTGQWQFYDHLGTQMGNKILLHWKWFYINHYVVLTFPCIIQDNGNILDIRQARR